MPMWFVFVFLQKSESEILFNFQAKLFLFDGPHFETGMQARFGVLAFITPVGARGFNVSVSFENLRDLVATAKFSSIFSTQLASFYLKIGNLEDELRNINKYFVRRFA